MPVQRSGCRERSRRTKGKKFSNSAHSSTKNPGHVGCEAEGRLEERKFNANIDWRRTPRRKVVKRGVSGILRKRSLDQHCLFAY